MGDVYSFMDNMLLSVCSLHNENQILLLQGHPVQSVYNLLYSTEHYIIDVAHK